MSRDMLRSLQTSITLICVILCTTTPQVTAQTPEETTVPTIEAPLAPKCEGDICYCIKGTHEAIFKGRKYCAPDSTESCTKYAIRISPHVCECKKGYRFLNDERTVCVSEQMEETTEITTTSEHSAQNSKEPCPEHAIRSPQHDCECKNGYHYRNDDRTTCIPDEAVDENTSTIPTATTQTPNITTTTDSISTTSTKPKHSDESEVPCNSLYIYVGIAVLIITALILIVLLCLLLKR